MYIYIYEWNNLMKLFLKLRYFPMNTRLPPCLTHLSIVVQMGHIYHRSGGCRRPRCPRSLPRWWPPECPNPTPRSYALDLWRTHLSHEGQWNPWPYPLWMEPQQPRSQHNTKLSCSWDMSLIRTYVSGVGWVVCGVGMGVGDSNLQPSDSC